MLAHARRARGEVDVDDRTVEAARVGVALAQLCAELDPRLGELGADDALVTLVVEHDDDDLLVLLYGSHELGGLHQVRAVTDQDEDITGGGGAGHAVADARGDLVAHARERILDVDVGSVGGVPDLVDVLDDAAGAEDDCVVAPRALVEGMDNLRLGHLLAGVRSEIGCQKGLGCALRLADLCPVALARPVADRRQRFVQPLQRKLRVADDGQRPDLVRVE
jgi:hypothetical protein